MIANERGSFPDIHGKVHFGSADHEEAKSFRQRILFNSEDDIQFPNLTVAQTLDFALRNKTSENKQGKAATSGPHISDMKKNILHDLGVSHTANTLVGNEYVRGVSGGERKRVSIAEMLAAQVFVPL